ncbi:MAG: hypothetical protein ACON4O_09465 [Lentimonas sp.]
MNYLKNIKASAQPDGNGHQVTFSQNGSRKVYRFPSSESEVETPPHGAGSFHDPEHHQKLMDRIENYIAKK